MRTKAPKPPDDEGEEVLFQAAPKPAPKPPVPVKPVGVIKLSDEVQTEAAAVQTRAEGLAIRSDLDLDACYEALKELKRMMARISDDLDEPIKRAHDAHKSLTTLKKKHMDPLVAAETELKRRAGQYTQLRQAKLEEAQRAAERAARQAADEARRLELEAAKASGATKEELAVVQAAPLAIAPVVIAAAPKTEGVRTNVVYNFNVRNPDLVPRELCSPDERKLRERVRSMGKAAIGTIPGVEVYAYTNVAVTA